MSLDSIIKSIVEGNVEQLLLYFPILIIGVGFLILITTYIKDHWKAISEKFKLSKLKKKTKLALSKKTAKGITARLKQKTDYKKETENILREKDPAKAMDRLSILINQYFSDMFDLHHAFTYEELISELEKKGRTQLKEFCENLLHIEFSKNEVSREEIESTAHEFLNIIKKHPPKQTGIPTQKSLFKRIKFFNQLKRFKKELLIDLEKQKTIQGKLEKFIGKTSSSVWTSIRSYLLPAKVPRKVSFNKVLEDVNKHKPKKGLESFFDEDNPTVESFFYYAYLLIRKKVKERKKVKQIKEMLKKGHELLEERDVIHAEETYNLIVQVYNSLSEEDRRKIFHKIVSFYEDITDCIKFQKAMMYMLQLKLALKSGNEKARQFYSKISETYEQLPPKYKNEIYEQFLNLEKELNIRETEGGV